MARPKASTIAINSQDLSGVRFYKLVAQTGSPAPTGHRTLWLCLCDCGQTKVFPASMLLRGEARSCGCTKKKHKIKYGYSPKNKVLVNTWFGIIKRCYDEKCTQYKWYGSRGIKVCDRWRHGDDDNSGLDYFVNDMGPKPSPSHSIDRIDNDGNYEPGNCRWVTMKEQAANKRPRKKRKS